MKLPRNVNGAKAKRALLKLGFNVDRQDGSHLILVKGSRTAIVPQHAKPIKVGTLAQILRQAGITVETFIDAL